MVEDRRAGIHAQPCGPVQARGLVHQPDIKLLKLRPRSQQLADAFLAIGLGPGLEGTIAVQPCSVGLQRIPDGHFSAHHGRGIFGQQSLGLLQIGEAKLGHRERRGLEALANQLAAAANPRKMLLRWNVSDQVCIRRLLPRIRLGGSAGLRFCDFTQTASDRSIKWPILGFQKRRRSLQLNGWRGG